MEERKLHIGCGLNYLPGWINIDIFSSVKADVYADLSALPFEPNSFSCIYCSHCLEHVHRHCILSTLTHWYTLLKHGGALRLAVPDFGACVDWYNRTGDLPSLIGLMYGGQTNWKNTHHIIFDETTLTRALTKVGFKQENIRRWDWRKTDHAAYDDYSQAYLPTMDKDSGLLMSLNLEAIK